MTNIVFCDIETTGLDPQKDAITEIALIKGDEERTWWIQLTEEELGKANTQALKIIHYYDCQVSQNYEGHRGNWIHHTVQTSSRKEIALYIARLTAGCILAGNTVKFDQQFLEVWLRRHGACPVWDYHVLDVPTFACGVLAERLKSLGLDPDDDDDEERELIKEALLLPFKSSKTSEALAVPAPEGDDKHTALADARWSKKIWDAVS